jgi:AraC-like DNA-binding protein
MFGFRIFHHIRQTTGTTVNHYIRIKRLGLARQEILLGASAQKAAYRMGFNDYSNFYRAYKSFYGGLPSALSRTNVQNHPAWA